MSESTRIWTNKPPIGDKKVDLSALNTPLTAVIKTMANDQVTIAEVFNDVAAGTAMENERVKFTSPAMAFIEGPPIKQSLPPPIRVLTSLFPVTESLQAADLIFSIEVKRIAHRLWLAIG